MAAMNELGMSAFSGEVAAEFVQRFWPTGDHEPKHEKLCRAFASAISQGFWASGARLPTEAELAEVTPCSLGTIQRALRKLAADGLIERRRGSGTIVASLSRVVEQPWHMRFFDDASGTPDDPFKTLRVAVSVAAESGKDVYVCNGTYREQLTVTAAVSIYGGYDCTRSWKRIADRAVVEPGTGVPLVVQGVRG